MERIRTKISALLTRSGPAKSPVPVKEMASIKGLLSSTWVSTGSGRSAANMQTLALGWVVESRPLVGPKPHGGAVLTPRNQL